MQIFIDADAFPNVIRDILIKASLRLNIPLVFVANKTLRLEKLPALSLALVPEGHDERRACGIQQERPSGFCKPTGQLFNSATEIREFDHERK